ncbi:Pre-mrna-splicing factor clf1 [Thalictrum thalictroides]|uniref:Pre-mrna-splicing factor clf1 n=1 Tax=Thalictrum thalictroides TaxID=46969 RepID=A0A7J6VLU0_THATH|nr:Pre-mrna-splicing factor clf1 [Thalictrum thalictroides]
MTSAHRECQEDVIVKYKVITNQADLDHHDEVADYLISRRREFEESIEHAGRSNIDVWITYVKWEASLKQVARARSICERALEEVVGYRNPSLWCVYAEIELENNYMDPACRKVLDRAVTLHPRVPQLWYKFIELEERLGNVASARTLFERWMCWMPDHQGWLSYIKFEIRYNEIERARQIFEKLVQCHPRVESWIRYAKFEMKNGEVGKARNVYERAVEKFAGSDCEVAGFPEFKKRCIGRAWGLDRIRKDQVEFLYNKAVLSENRSYGDIRYRKGVKDSKMKMT